MGVKKLNDEEKEEKEDKKEGDNKASNIPARAALLNEKKVIDAKIAAIDEQIALIQSKLSSMKAAAAKEEEGPAATGAEEDEDEDEKEEKATGAAEAKKAA